MGVCVLKKLNDEKIMSALIAVGSVRGASAVADVSETTIRSRLNDPEFREKYAAEKSRILTEACDALVARLTLAVDTLCKIIADEKSPSTVKISASDSILRHGLRYVEVANITSRIEALEKAQNINN